MAARVVGLSPGAAPGVPPFVELAARSGFSLLDGASNPETLAERAAELGMPALALADRFDLGGAVRFARACEEVGVRPITGAEIRAVIGSGAAGGAPVPVALALLCEDRGGYHRLCGLVTEARLSGPRGTPLLPLFRLAGRTDGLLCLLRASDLGPEASPGTETGATAALGAIDRLRVLFPGRLWVALEHHGLPEDGRACVAWLALCRRAGVPWVPVNSPRYARPSDRIVHDVLTCLRHGVTLDEAGDLLRPNAEWHLKGGEAMAERWCFARGGDAGPVPRVGFHTAEEARSTGSASPSGEAEVRSAGPSSPFVEAVAPVPGPARATGAAPSRAPSRSPPAAASGSPISSPDCPPSRSLARATRRNSCADWWSRGRGSATATRRARESGGRSSTSSP